MHAFDPHALECLAAIVEEGGFFGFLVSSQQVI
jgi:hypothetical protein